MRHCVLTIAAIAGIATPALACETSQSRACLVNEDSHPHEVRPGGSAEFQIETTHAGQDVSVRCMLSGPVSPVRIMFSSMTPRGWAAQNREVSIGGETHIEIRGVTTGREAVSFTFVNLDPARLLWHQCYNGGV